MNKLTRSDLFGGFLGALGVAASFLFAGPLAGYGAVAVAVVLLILWLWKKDDSASKDTITWLDVESRFKALEARNLLRRGDGPLHAFESDAYDEGSGWYVGGGGSEVTDDGKRLCRLAGRKLQQSGIAPMYPRLKGEKDDLSRWLYFLGEIGQADQCEVSSNGETTVYHNIRFLTRASLAGCVECLKQEMKVTT